MSFITEQGIQDLENNDTVGLAHLIALQLPGSGNNYVYFTDYFRDVELNGIVYESGRVKSVGQVRQTKTLTNFDVTISISGALDDELHRALESTEYIGNTLTIKRVFLDSLDKFIWLKESEPEITYFKGEVKSISIRDNYKLQGQSKSTITWTAASMLSNFDRVNGRLTDDASHRGLVNVNGTLQPSGSAKKVEYQTDKGFFHAGQSINVLAKYQTKEKRYKLVSKKASGFAGWIGGKKYKQVEYWATVTKEVDLDINLATKYLPVSYGVQRTPGIPVFFDTPADKPNEIWAVYAFCEGEIDGFLDFYIDDNPIICVNQEDINTRACFGNKRGSGDTISIAQAIGETPGNPNSNPSIHGEKYTYNDGSGPIDMWMYHGKSDQTACPELVERALNNKFRIQQMRGMGPEYWDEAFKLLDTAYVVMRIEINSERTNIPSIEAEVQGKKVRIYDENGIVSDNSTSTNLAWQTLDYLSSTIYGAGIPLEDLPLSSFIESAGYMDIIDTSYEVSWVPYWRYLGWLDINPNNRKIVQGSAILNTSTEVFKNVDALLSQVDASLNIIDGKYKYSVEALRTPVADIHIDDIKEGSFSFQDLSSRSKWNSIQASISDPANSWNTTAVTFYNELFLQEDLNRELKGNLVFPFITNYYTARSMAERALKKSRMTKKVTFSLPFKFAYLSTNDTITLTHPRYRWDKKKFMIEDTSWNPDGSITVTLKEYEDDIFLNSDQSDASDDQNGNVIVNVLPPTNLVYTPESKSQEVGVNGTLSWDASESADVAFYSIKRTGTIDVASIPVPAGSVQEVFSYVVRNLDAGLYTFQVRAVNVQGQVSKPAILDVNIDPSVNLPIVPNFRLINKGIGDDTFVGGFIRTEWDSFEEDPAGLQYEIEYLNGNGDLLKSYTLPSSARIHTFTQDEMKAAHIAVTGNLGIYRWYQVRIRAIGTGGAASVDWVYTQ